MVPPLQFAGWEWVAFALATPVVFWAGFGFHRAALQNARHVAATMDTLISIGTLAAWVWSAVVLVGGLDADTYFEVAAVDHDADPARSLPRGARQEPLLARRSARCSSSARRRRVSCATASRCSCRSRSVVVGDLFVVRPGEKIATDGVVVEGESAVDQSMLTGESRAGRGRRPAAEVAGATVNTYGRLVVRATKVGADTALAQIARLVAAAQSGKAPVQRLADRVSAVFVPIVIAALARDARRVAGQRSDCCDRLHGRGRRAHHRLPVRARSRDADGAHGRDRPRRAARDPHQGPGDPRADAADRHDRARQDGHGHGGPDGARGGPPAERRHARRGPAARRRRRGGVRASDRPGDRERGAGARSARSQPSPASGTLPGVGVIGHGRRSRGRGRPPRRRDHGRLGRRAARDARRPSTR